MTMVLRVILLISLLSITAVFGGSGDCTSKWVGCFRDSASRAISGGIRLNSNNPIVDCKNYARARGWTIFAVQYSIECFTAPDAGLTYRKYGGANNCNNGRGGDWANDVYEITCGPEFECTSEETGQTLGPNESYINDNGKKCVCGSEGFVCLCDDTATFCPAGSSKWTDQLTCKAKCIKDAAYCSSSGDPHYLSFDGKYFDFHGTCTYQAASCDDFQVNFKNEDLYGRAPRFTKRAELEYKGKVFAIENGYVATVDGEKVQVPYVKKYTSGDSVQIQNNGELEIVFYQNSKGRIPATRIRANNAGRYINAEISLHGSCSQETEGMCGNWNGNPADDLTGGSPNSLGNMHQQYDENCPAPPPPCHPCDDFPQGHERAGLICDALKGAPFSSCHSTVNYGDLDGGVYRNCLTDVCNCMMEQTCACSQFDVYATQCSQRKVDVSNWRESVDYCPYMCPKGLTYQASASIPSPSCLDRTPEQESTARGCFCPSGRFLQDGVCVDASQCKCIYEGIFYNVGDVIKEKAECQSCTCVGEGKLNCVNLVCPALSCAGDEVQAQKEDSCCGYCAVDWVKAANPDVKVNKGQTVALTCEIDVKGVMKKDITWSKDGTPISTGISEDRLVLKVRNADTLDGGKYSCNAAKNDKTDTADFKVAVEIPVVPRVEVSAAKFIVNCKKGKRGCKVQFKVKTTDGSKVIKKNVKICKFENGVRSQCKKGKGKRTSFKLKLSKKVEDSSYICVVTLDGKEYVSEASSVRVQ